MFHYRYTSLQLDVLVYHFNILNIQERVFDLWTYEEYT